MYLSEKAAEENAGMIIEFKFDSQAPITKEDLERAFIDGVKWERERTVKLIEAITAAQNAATCINNAVRQIVGGFSERDFRL